MSNQSNTGKNCRDRDETKTLRGDTAIDTADQALAALDHGAELVFRNTAGEIGIRLTRPDGGCIRGEFPIAGISRGQVNSFEIKTMLKKYDVEVVR